MKNLKQTLLPGRIQIYAAAVFIVYVYHLVRYIDYELWSSIYAVYYVLLIPALIASHFWMRGRMKFQEEKLLFLYWIWIYISRLMCGDAFLAKDADIVLNMGLACVLLSSCLIVTGKERERFLDWISVVTAGYYSLLSLAGLYAVLYRKELFNPLTGSLLCGFETAMSRLTFFYKSSNECTMWFFIAFFLLVYLFNKKKNLLWRIAIVPAAAANYLALAMTFSRNGMITFSIGIGMLAAAIGMRHVKFSRRLYEILLGGLFLCVFAAGTFLSFDLATAAMRKASLAIVCEETPAAVEQTAEPHVLSWKAEMSKEQAGIQTDSNTYVDNRRLLDDSGRIEIYKSIIPTMEQEPERLLHGCLCNDVMSISNTVLSKPKPHFHNTFLQVLVLTGLPGLALTLAFSLLLAVKIVRLYFSGARLDIICLLIILTGSLFYNMLETALFIAADIRTLIFYILAGAVLAYSDELLPGTPGKKTAKL